MMISFCSQVLLLSLVGLSTFNAQTVPCSLRRFPDGFVCVCNSTYCDTLTDVLPSSESDMFVISSSKNGLRFAITQTEFNQNETHRPAIVHDYNNLRRNISESPRTKRKVMRSTLNVVVAVNRMKQFQKLVGFGGAFTGAVSENFKLMDTHLQDYIYKSYYSNTEGIGYNMMRLSIGGCDFDLEPWAYNEQPINDVALSNFTKLDNRDLTIIKQIKRLKEVAINADIKLMGAAWSSPPWMKTNNRWTGASAMLSQYYQTWADYHIKYLHLMADQNVTFWAISTGNEPLNGVIAWLFVKFMSLGWTGTSQGHWVANNMGPALNKSIFKDVRLFACDDQRYALPLWMKQMENANRTALSFIDGIAVHWYWDTIVPPTLLDETHAKYPEKLIINTESCVGDKPFQFHGPLLGSWDRAEQYATAYIEDFRHHVNGWIDWNLILNVQGGPNYVDNYVDAAIIVNTTSGKEAYKQPFFYIIGHFSRFAIENSVRIDTASSNSKYIESVGFERPDGSVAVIVLNKYSSRIKLTVNDSKSGTVTLTIPPKSIHTLIYK